MASLIARCLDKLVAGGEVSRKTADAALALHEGLQGRLGAAMPSASADAAAALETARILGDMAKARKLSLAKQMLRSDEALTRQAAHPKNKTAGLMGWLGRDPFERGAANVESKAEVVFGALDRHFGLGNEALGSKLAGLRQDRALAQRVVREIFGENTGDDTARQIAKGWGEATALAVSRAQAGGRIFSVLDDWRLPQPWESGRVRKFGEATFTADVLAEIEGGGLRLMDQRTGGPAAALAVPSIIKTAYDDIALGGGKGGGGTAFNPAMRTFRFGEGKAGADSFLRLMEKYGSSGRDLYSGMRGHLKAASMEIAFTDLLGPDYRATFRAMHGEATRDWNKGKKSPLLIRFLSSPAAADRTFRVLTGEANAVQSELIAGIGGGLRGWLASAQLGGAVLAAVPGDTATLALAARYNGISAVRVLQRTVSIILADTADKRALAARLGVVAHASAETVLTGGRFAGEWLDQRFAGKLASTVIRASGLAVWTDALKRAWTMEMLGLVADQAKRDFGQVDAVFGRFLQRHGISAGEWDVLRKAPAFDVDGARFFDTEGVADVQLREKLLGAIIDERRYAVLEPEAIVRQATTGGLQRGTFWGEAARSTMMYKSFPIAFIATHMMRVAIQDDLTSKLALGLQTFLFTTMAGAAIIQAKSLAGGRDPRPMDDSAFWGAAMIAGGGTGIFGDLLYSGLTRADSSFAATLAGPVGSLVDAAASIVFPTWRALVEGEETDVGVALYKQVKRNLPGGNLWYSRLALDRLLFDRIQMAVDTEYRRSFRRTEERAREQYGQPFWWAPGETAPARGPDLSNAVAGGS